MMKNDGLGFQQEANLDQENPRVSQSDLSFRVYGIKHQDFSEAL